MFYYGSNEKEVTDQDVFYWAESTIKKLEKDSYLTSSEKRELATAKLLIKLKEKSEELERQLKSVKERLSSTIEERDQKIKELQKELEDLKKKIGEYEVKFSNLDEHGVSISGPNEALDILWNLIKNQGWELFDIRVEGASLRMVKIKGVNGDFYIFRVKDEIKIHTEASYEKKLKEKISYITPLGKFEKDKEKLPRALKDALTKALAQYFELVKIEMKIEIFMTNILPFARLAGIEVGDPNRVRPFLTWTSRIGNEKEVTPIYTPEQVYRGFVSARNSKYMIGHVDTGELGLSAITRTLVEFMNYTIQQIAIRYPEVVSEALNLAARTVGKLPTTSLVDLGGSKIEEAKEVEETG